MRYHLLGSTGLRVSELSLGTMTFGDGSGWTSTADESRAVYTAYRNAGGNFIDTADCYGAGKSERILCDLVATERDEVVLASKYTIAMPGRDPNAGGNQRKNLVQSVEGSLRRLGTDFLDVFWVHAWDFVTPTEEIMRTLDDQVRAGKVLHVGVSNAPAWAIARANTLAELRGWTPFAAIQVEYSLIERTPERDLIPMSKSLGLSVTAWSPLAGGLLSGKYAQGKSSERLADQAGDKTRRRSIAESVVVVAEELRVEPAQVALRWLLDQGALPILGARTAAQLSANMACLEVTLPEAAAKRLDAASRVDLGFPHAFLKKNVRYTYGGVRDQLVAAELRGAPREE